MPQVLRRIFELLLRPTLVYRVYGGRNAVTGLWQAAEKGEFDYKATLALAKERMEKSMENVQGNLETLRTGRAK